jgi:hypothetical protein
MSRFSFRDMQGRPSADKCFFYLPGMAAFSAHFACRRSICPIGGRLIAQMHSSCIFFALHINNGIAYIELTHR